MCLLPRLLVALLCCSLLTGCQPAGVAPTLSELHGCDDVWYEPGAGKDGGTYVCALLPSSGTAPRIWVQTAAPAGVAVGPSGLQPQLSAEGRLTVDAVQLPQLLTLTERSPLGGPTNGPAVHLRLVRQQRLSVEVLADTARKQHTIAKGLTELRAALQTPPYSTEPVARARLLHALADLEVTAGQHTEARHHFEQTLELAVPAQLTMIVANSARLLAFQHFSLRRDIPTALAILKQYDAALHMIDIESVLALYNRGVYAQERGYLSDAVRLLAAAKDAVKDLGEDDSRRGIAVMYAVVLAQQGLTQKAEAEVQEMLGELRRPGGGWEVCERMRILNSLGWTRILGQESRSAGALDPIPLFTQALFYRAQDSCANDGKGVAMNWARAELLVAERLAESAAAAGHADSLEGVLLSHLQAAEDRLAEGTRNKDDLSASEKLDATEIRGRIAYLRSNFDAAKDEFAKLLALAHSVEEPDYMARALIGQALVWAALARTADAATADGYTQKARAAFEQAEAQLDERQGLVPLTAARRAFLPRFTAGTAAFLEFLIAHQQHARAFEVARRAQVRGLVATLSFDTLSLLPEAQRSHLMKERDEFVQNSAQSTDKVATGQKFEQLLAHLRSAGLGQMPLHVLQPGEAMHLCHPLPHGDLACFVAAPGELQVERISARALHDAIDPRQQAALLLTPFARLIDRAQVLRILPSQKLREVNFPALPWSSGDSSYLASRQRLVVYALDLDLGNRAAVPPEVRGKALMLTNLNLQHAQKSAPGLFARLQQLGWQVTPYSNQRFDHGTNPRRRLLCWLGLESCPATLQLPVAPKPGTASQMKLALPEVELAQLDTHARYDSDSGWQSELTMPDQSRLSIFDLLTLRRAPRWTVLLVCEGGTAGQGSDADDISLAQALLLRGGEAVVASTRPLEDVLGSEWSKALYGTADSPTAYLNAAAPSLTEAFRAAQATLRDRHVELRDWSALRLFVP